MASMHILEGVLKGGSRNLSYAIVAFRFKEIGLHARAFYI